MYVCGVSVSVLETGGVGADDVMAAAATAAGTKV